MATDQTPTQPERRAGAVIEFGPDGSGVTVVESFATVLDRLASGEGWPLLTVSGSGKRIAINPANVESVYDLEAPSGD